MADREMRREERREKRDKKCISLFSLWKHIRVGHVVEEGEKQKVCDEQKFKKNRMKEKEKKREEE
jgi:hypothetical protein